MRGQVFLSKFAMLPSIDFCSKPILFPIVASPVFRNEATPLLAFFTCTDSNTPQNDVWLPNDSNNEKTNQQVVEPCIKTKQKTLCQIGSFLQGSKKKHVKHRCNQHLGTWLIAGVPVWSCPVDEQNPEPVAMPYEPSQLATSRTSRNPSTRAPKNQWDRKLIFLFKKNAKILAGREAT